MAKLGATAVALADFRAICDRLDVDRHRLEMRFCVPGLQSLMRDQMAHWPHTWDTLSDWLAGAEI